MYQHFLSLLCVFASVCGSGDYVRKNVTLVAANWLFQLIPNGMK